jgi:hypothetical protein
MTIKTMKSSNIIAERGYNLKDKIKNFRIECDVKTTSHDKPIGVGTGRQAAALFSIL